MLDWSRVWAVEWEFDAGSPVAAYLTRPQGLDATPRFVSITRVPSYDPTVPSRIVVRMTERQMRRIFGEVKV